MRKIDYRYFGDQKYTSKYTSAEIQICELNQRYRVVNS